MKLNQAGLLDTAAWEQAGITLPKFDRARAVQATHTAPVWVHFGAGNIFRAFPAFAQQKLLEQGYAQQGIVAAFTMEPEVIDALWKPCDNLSLLVTLKADGTTDKHVVGSVTEALYADEANPQDWARLVSIFENPSLQMVSFTITEKGYADKRPGSAMEKLTRLLVKRFENGAQPLSLVSMDNCSHNGEKLYEAVAHYARAFVESAMASADFLAYIADPAKVAFPWTMIDKITPRPDESVAQSLRALGFEDADTIVTKQGTYASAFVNAEEAEYLVIEDAFPAGRPALEKAGVIFTDRDTVNLVEKMKVCTCLNPLHTALAVFGCVLGFPTIAAEMQDADLSRMAYTLGFVEGMPVVADPKIIDPKAFLHEVLTLRLPNPFLPDTPFRIATDTSQKMPVRFGETVKAYLARPDLSLDDLTVVPLVIAAWCRYLMGIDDAGSAFTPSPDPKMEELAPHLAGLHLGEAADVHAHLQPILSRADFFGVDLYETPLAAKAEAYFARMIAGKGAVRDTLRETMAACK